MTHRRVLGFFRGFLLLALFLVLGWGNAFGDEVIDNGGGGTSSTGYWEVSGASGSYGANSYWSRDGSTYTWTFRPSVSGSYEVSMWWTVWPSRSTSVPVDIRHAGGSARVVVDQQSNGSRWNVLGVYSFSAGASYTVTVTSQPGPSSTCADAVRFVNVGGGGNQAPVAVNDAASTVPGAAVTVDVVSNDTDDVGIDPGSVAIVGSPSHGQAVSNGNGTVTYTPEAGFAGTDSFTYTVSDGQGEVSNAATVTVEVRAASAEVVIDNGKPGTSFTGVWEVSGASGFYGSNSFWSRDGAVYNWTFTPSVSGSYEVSMWWTVWPSRSSGVPVDIEHAGGTAVLFVDQQHNGGQWNSLGVYSLVGGVSYTVSVTSQPGPSSTSADAVKFTYLGGGSGNQPPVARDDSAATTMDAAVSIVVLANDTDDVGLDAASVTVASPPSNGTAVALANGTVTYTPEEAFTGTDTFTYTVADADGAVSNPATVTVTVNGRNQAPVAANDAASTTAGVAVNVNVLSNDTDDTGINPASVAIVGPPGAGSASVGGGSVTYTPNPGFTGTDTFTYTVADLQGSVSNPATVTITVSAAAVEVIVDNGRTGTSSTGYWDISGASGSYGSDSFWSRDGSAFTWTFTPAVSGAYEVSMWWTVWPSRSTSVPVDIRHAGGTARVMINQQSNGSRWNVLGVYSFSAGASYTVTVTAQPGPTSTCADAVKFTYNGADVSLPPTAVIDSISPNPALPGAAVEFTGHGTDSNGGEAFGYSWRSSIDGVLSSSASFNSSALSAGQHMIYFKVQDDLGVWSAETSAPLIITNQAADTEHVYLLLVYNAYKNDYLSVIQSLGATPEGDAWKYVNLTNGKTYYIHFAEDIEAAKLALYTENAHIILTGHSNYGLGGIFPKPGEMPTTVMYDVYHVDDPRIWAYSSPWVGLSVRGMIRSQAYPNWWPDFQDGADAIMPYDFSVPGEYPPYNYFISYRVPGDPTYYRVETTHNAALERFPGSGATPWFSTDGGVPSPSNPDHRRYYIINTDTSGDYGTCGASPCPKPHYSSRTIVFRKDLELDITRLRYKTMLIDTCTSGNYYLDTFQHGIVFFTKDNTDGNGGYIFLTNLLRGRSVEEIWQSLGGYQGIYDYYDFGKRPFEQ